MPGAVRCSQTSPLRRYVPRNPPREVAMISISRRCGTLIATFCLIVNVSLGDSFAPKPDNRIICVDLRTGELLWEHIPKEMSDAHFEWYMDGVVAYPHYS